MGRSRTMPGTPRLRFNVRICVIFRFSLDTSGENSSDMPWNRLRASLYFQPIRRRFSDSVVAACEVLSSRSFDAYTLFLQMKIIT